MWYFEYPDFLFPSVKERDKFKLYISNYYEQFSDEFPLICILRANVCLTMENKIAAGQWRCYNTRFFGKPRPEVDIHVTSSLRRNLQPMKWVLPVPVNGQTAR